MLCDWGCGSRSSPGTPESLLVEGVPKILAELAETAARHGAYRSAAIADWHPMERKLLIRGSRKKRA